MCKYRLTDMTEQAKIISFANHKGGGKTTTTASVGSILAGLGKKVLFVSTQPYIRIYAHTSILNGETE